MHEPLILLLAAAYVGVLFAVAYYADEQAALGRSVIQSPVVYALSLAVYCTAWTFYGSVGRAATTGPGFLPIYLGPTLTAILGWVVLRKMLRISKHHRITSIADFIGSRYGKSAGLAGLAAVAALLGVVPYLALQLKAISASYLALSGQVGVDPGTAPVHQDTAFWTAAALAVFTILFGTRHLDVTERHEGIVAAIAFESVVKLVAFLAVGGFVTFGLYDGFGDLFRAGAAVPDVRDLYTLGGGTTGMMEWVWLTGLSMLAVLLLPRQFQIGVVENIDESHLRTAIWLFPLYLLAINLFVLPLAVAGLLQFGSAAEADAFVLTLPLAAGNDALALLAFLGGFSAGTGMVIVAATALTTMICNDLVVPVLLRIPALRLAERSRLTGLLLAIRRGGIVCILLLAFLYVRTFGQEHSLVAIGLISFAAVAQFAPSVLGGLYWKGGTRRGAMAGLVAGVLVWGYTLPLPSLVDAGWLEPSFITAGPFGWELLRPYALLGLDVFEPVPHALFWSLLVNAGAYVVVSVLTRPTLVERSQAVQFVDVFRRAGPAAPHSGRATAPVEELRKLLRRYLGGRRADRALADYARQHDLDPAALTRADGELVHYAEQLLSGVLGAASARVVVNSVVQKKRPCLDEVMHMLDETQQALATNRELQAKRRELQRTTRELQAANAELRELDRRKDDFVSTVSHELRTPLTAIRANAELLRDHPALDPEQQAVFLDTIVREVRRLARLVDQVLDLQRLDAPGDGSPHRPVDLRRLVANAAAAVRPQVQKRNLRLSVAVGRGEDAAPPPESEPCVVDGDPDRLFQGVLNLLSNATKYACASVDLRVRPADDAVEVIVADDGDGIHPDDQDIIFQPFTQARRTGPQPGSGLGLAIARRIVEEHGGTLAVDSEPGEGATFRVCLPVREPPASGERTPEKESPPPATGCDEPELDSGRPKATSPSIQDLRSAPQPTPHPDLAP